MCGGGGVGGAASRFVHLDLLPPPLTDIFYLYTAARSVAGRQRISFALEGTKMGTFGGKCNENGQPHIFNQSTKCCRSLLMLGVA